MESLIIRNAQINDSEMLVNLVNKAYREEGGWTTESQLLGGIRINSEKFLEMLQEKKTHIFVGEINEKIVATIKIYQENGRFEMGLFAVDNSLQGKGIGAKMLSFAEDFLQKKGIEKIFIQVFTQRTELINFYERKGFVKIPEIVDFDDLSTKEGIMKVSNLCLQTMLKIIE